MGIWYNDPCIATIWCNFVVYLGVLLPIAAAKAEKGLTYATSVSKIIIFCGDLSLLSKRDMVWQHQ